MGWERRRNQWYYYRAHRHGDRVVKEYVGRGLKGQQAAEADEAVRLLATDVVHQRQEEERFLNAISDDLREIEQLTDQLFTVQFVSLGWKKHHRAWRQKHDA
jgi:hypothetical protein